MATMADRPPSRADGRGSFSVATYNVRCGRNAGLESALRAMAATEVDLGIFTETKITDSVYTRYSSGYNVTATNAVSASQGGIALFWRDNELYEIKEVAPRGPNVLTFELVMGQIWCFVMGAYIPPSDLGTTLTQIHQAWLECPRGCQPLLLGDLLILTKESMLFHPTLSYHQKNKSNTHHHARLFACKL